MTKEELEKEATEYAQKLGAKDFIAKPKEIVAYFGYLAGAESREKQILELEKENAKLKTDYKVLSCSVGDFGELQNRLEEEQRKNNGLEEQLTKAKEIIRAYLKLGYGAFGYCTANEIIEKAEAFLKE